MPPAMTNSSPPISPAAVAAACPAQEARFGAGCRFEPVYRPAPLDTRVTPRER